MHLRKTWILVSAMAAFAVQAAVIYKWTDADGVVHYSDQAVPGAERMVTAGISSSGTVTGGSAQGSNAQTARAPGTASASGLNYSQFAITSPLNEQTFFNDDVVSVHLELDPALKPNQTITWHLSGKSLDQPPTSTSFALQGLERGTYVLAATIIDQATGDSQTTDSVTFYLRQPSALSPQHK
jgi:Domain of unknown function (DUF4124)